MGVVSLNPSVQAPSAAAPAPVTPADKAAENREVVQAIKALNGSEMFGHDNELIFQRDRLTQRMVIRVVNRKTKEVISQIPPEYLLRLAADPRQNGGSL
ncbi:MAG: flagellar protein FlaG [Acidobacteriia bacterium]|nr:flagellar protein FlaG [Terriglobia bacterium]